MGARAVILCVVLTGCWPAESSVLGKKCNSTAACGDGLLCTAGVCLVDPNAGGQPPSTMNPPSPGTVLFGEAELKWVGIAPSTVDSVSAMTRSQPSASQMKNGGEGLKIDAETNSFNAKAGEICSEIYLLKTEPAGSVEFRIVTGTGDAVKASAAGVRAVPVGQWTRIFTSFKVERDTVARLTFKETTAIPRLVVDDTAVKAGACTQ